MPDSEFAIWVYTQDENDYSNSPPIVAERAMYFDHDGVTGGHQAMGVQNFRYEWYFAEGYTGPGFDEYICLYNPGHFGESRVQLDLIDRWGSVHSQTDNMPEAGRITIRVNDLLDGDCVSAHVKTIDNFTIVAERSMYFQYAEGRTGGSVAHGVATPSTHWYFAEGYSGN